MNTEIKDDFIGTKFGPFLQLTVLGWFGEKSLRNKKYTVQCSICKEDSELYGDAKYLITRNKINRGTLPCGCSPNNRWSKEQWIVKLKRECDLRNYKFIAFNGDRKGGKGSVYLETPYGEVDLVIIHNFLKGQDTLSLRNEKISKAISKSTEHHTEKYLKTGAFALGTTFERCLDKVDHRGWKSWWKVHCSTCDEIYYSLISNLSAGCVGCSCSQRRHIRSYIHVVSQDGKILGIKFGITSLLNSRRMSDQSRKSGLTLEEFGLWEYSEVSSCRQSEREVKRIFANYLTKDILPDGYTETASFNNIEEIVYIFENNGGVRIR